MLLCHGSNSGVEWKPITTGTKIKYEANGVNMCVLCKNMTNGNIINETQELHEPHIPQSSTVLSFHCITFISSLNIFCL